MHNVLDRRDRAALGLVGVWLGLGVVGLLALIVGACGLGVALRVFLLAAGLGG